MFTRHHLFCHLHLKRMKPSFSALGLIAPLAVLVLGFAAAHAQTNDLFPSRAAAEKRT